MQGSGSRAGGANGHEDKYEEHDEDEADDVHVDEHADDDYDLGDDGDDDDDDVNNCRYRQRTAKELWPVIVLELLQQERVANQDRISHCTTSRFLSPFQGAVVPGQWLRSRMHCHKCKLHENRSACFCRYLAWMERFLLRGETRNDDGDDDDDGDGDGDGDGYGYGYDYDYDGNCDYDYDHGDGGFALISIQSAGY
jgi:hypothetical protein